LHQNKVNNTSQLWINNRTVWLQTPIPISIKI
jgi:hypothetical protein